MSSSKHSWIRQIQAAARASFLRRVGLIAFGFVLALQPGCLFRGRSKAKAPQAPAPAVRIALLPFNIPADNTNLRWISLAAPLVMAKTIEKATSFEIVPVWQSYPAAIESLGAGRAVTPEVAAYVADRVGAKWATNGDLLPAKDGVWMRVDFIPARANLVPYRYEKSMRPDAMGANTYAAFSQFSDYLVLRPLPKFTGKGVTASSMRELAEALDREYGWYVPADPGKSEKLVTGLAKTDSQLARLFFDPILYPVVGSLAAKAKPVELRPVAAPKQEQPAPPAPTPETPQQIPPPPPQSPPPATEKPPQVAPATTQPAPQPITEEKAPAAPTAAPAPPAPTTPAVTPPRKSPPLSATRQPSSPGLRSGIPPSAAQPVQAPSAKTGDAAAGTGTKAAPPTGAGTIQIQVYSTQNKREADAKAASLAKAGYLPKVDQVDLREKGIWFRIRLQGFKTHEEAKATGEKLVADKVVQQYWVVP